MTSSTNWKLSSPAATTLIAALIQQHAPVYLVGGAVRDLLLDAHAEITDLDLVVEHEALRTAKYLADRLGWAYYPLDAERDMARLILNSGHGAPLVCDISSMRGGDIESDLSLRDFTINALCLVYTSPNQAKLLDICNGQADLQQGIIRRLSSTSLVDDEIRLLRGVRLAVQFGFDLESQTEMQLQRLAGNLHRASAERIRDELWKILATDQPRAGIAKLHAFGLLEHVLPDVAAMLEVTQSSPHVADVFHHTLMTVERAALLRQWIRAGTRVTSDPAQATLTSKLERWRDQLHAQMIKPLAAQRTLGDWLIWYALLHDIGKPQTREEQIEQDVRRVRFFNHEQVGAEIAAKLLERLRFSRLEIDIATAVIRNHMRPHHLHASFPYQQISRRARYRYFRDLDGKQSPRRSIATLLLALADMPAVYGALPPDWNLYLEHIDELLTFGLGDNARRPTPLVDGNTLMRKLSLQPGPSIGLLLADISEAQAIGEIETEAEAIEYAANRLKQETDGAV